MIDYKKESILICVHCFEIFFIYQSNRNKKREFHINKKQRNKLIERTPCQSKLVKG